MSGCLKFFWLAAEFGLSSVHLVNILISLGHVLPWLIIILLLNFAHLFFSIFFFLLKLLLSLYEFLIQLVDNSFKLTRIQMNGISDIVPIVLLISPSGYVSFLACSCSASNLGPKTLNMRLTMLHSIKDILIMIKSVTWRRYNILILVLYLLIRILNFTSI